MNLENSIKDVISKKLEDGTIEKIVEEQLEKGVVNALDSLFRSYGDVTKVIEEQIKSVMIPYLENYDYSKYIVKLDSVLVDVLKNSALDNKNLLKNFEKLITTKKRDSTIKVSELFEIWKENVAENVDTSDLDVITEDEVSYEWVDGKLEVEYDEDYYSWMSYKYGKIIFECEQDEKMNYVVSISRRKDDNDGGWKIDYKPVHDITSLRYIDEFELQLMELCQSGTKIIIDEDYIVDEEIQPKAEPEVSFY